METAERTAIAVGVTVARPIGTVWDAWTDPNHIVKWNQASSDWHTAWARNDLRPGGRFNSRMEARDGSTGFDFSGVYDAVNLQECMAYTLDDGRHVTVTFTSEPDGTRIDETFEAEGENPVEVQRRGWQSILDSFRDYVERLP